MKTFPNKDLTQQPTVEVYIIKRSPEFDELVARKDIVDGQTRNCPFTRTIRVLI